MSAVARVLPRVLAKYGCIPPTPASEVILDVPPPAPELQPAPVVAINTDIAFYRRYTEGLLRRYLRCSMEAGKVPSLMGKEMFRSKVSSYRMRSFEDIIIFMHDVERCLGRLDEDQQDLISRITLQEYTVLETAQMLDLSPKTVVSRYKGAIDRLSRIFLSVEILHAKDLVKGVTEAEDE